MPAKSEYHQQFCDLVRQRRIELGLRQSELAERLGVSIPYVSRIENGVAEPGLNLIRRLAVALECQPSEIMPAVPEVAVAR